MFQTAKQAWFKDILKEVEGSGGFDGNLWRPFESSEGGAPTIGFGHKLNHPVVFLGGNEIDTRVQPLTSAQIDELLEQDISVAENRAAEEYTRFGNRAGKPWGQLSLRDKSIFTEIVFNVGTLSNKSGGWGWSKLSKGMKFDNDPVVFEEIGRTFTSPSGEKVQLDSRVKKLVAAYKGFKEVEPSVPDFQGNQQLESAYAFQEATKPSTSLSDFAENLSAIDSDTLRRIKADNDREMELFQAKKKLEQDQKNIEEEFSAPEGGTPQGFTFEEGIFEQEGSMFEVLKVK